MLWQREGTEAHDSMFVFYSQVFSGPAGNAKTNASAAAAVVVAMPQGHADALNHAAGTSPLDKARAELAAAREEIAALRRAAGVTA